MTRANAGKGRAETVRPSHVPGRRGKALNISIRDAALEFRVSVTTIKNWERGAGRPTTYPGRDTGRAEFRASAEAYRRQLLRHGNVKRVKAGD